MAGHNLKPVVIELISGTVSVDTMPVIRASYGRPLADQPVRACAGCLIYICDTRERKFRSLLYPVCPARSSHAWYHPE